MIIHETISINYPTTAVTIVFFKTQPVLIYIT